MNTKIRKKTPSSLECFFSFLVLSKRSFAWCCEAKSSLKKRSFDGCCEAKSSFEKRSFDRCCEAKPSYCKAELPGFFLYLRAKYATLSFCSSASNCSCNCSNSLWITYFKLFRNSFVKICSLYQYLNKYRYRINYFNSYLL